MGKRSQVGEAATQKAALAKGFRRSDGGVPVGVETAIGTEASCDAPQDSNRSAGTAAACSAGAA